MDETLKNMLTADILRRYNNEEYWDKDIIQQYEDVKCDHEWSWNYDCFEDARILEADTLGIPVKCDKCGLEAIEWWGYSCVKDNNGNTIE